MAKEEHTAYKLMSCKYLGKFWYVDVTEHCRGWHGEGFWKSEMTLSKLTDGPARDKLICVITDNEISISFSCKKFKQEYVDAMDEMIVNSLVKFKAPFTLAIQGGMPNGWFTKLLKKTKE